MPRKFGKKRNLVGLDIGHHAIKLVALEPIPGGWRVLRVMQTPTPEGAVKEGSVIAPESVGDAIRQLIKDSRMTVSGCHLSVSSPAVIVRTVKIPKMSEAMLRKSIRFEAGRYIPNNVDESYVEFEITGEHSDGQMSVLMVAAPRELVDSRMRAAAAAGLEVECVDLEAFASYRSMVQANFGIDVSQDTFALVDIGSHSTKVSVIQKGQFAMTRTIPQAGSALTESLQKYFNLSFEHAEEGKAQLDLRGLLDETTPVENPPLRVMQPVLDDLVREMRRSLNYFQSQQTEAGTGQISWMLLTGGGAKLNGLAEYMSSRLGLKVYAAGVFDNPRFASLGEPFFGQGAEVAVATGLAMRSYDHAA